MKILLYTRRNVGLYCLSHLIALGHEVTVMTDDENVEWLADRYGCPVIENKAWEMMPEYDLFVCVHGDKIIPDEYLKGLMINVHPCLSLYKGHNPIKKYIRDGHETGSVSSLYITSEVDGGAVIHTEEFFTGKIKTYQEFYDAALPFYFKCLDETLNKILK